MATKKIVAPTPFDARSSFSRKKVVKMYEKDEKGKLHFNGLDENEEGKCSADSFSEEVVPNESMGNGMTMRHAMFTDMPSFAKTNEFIRRGNESPSSQTGGIEYSFAEAVYDRWGFASVDDFLRYGLDIDPSTATLQSFNQISDIPEGARYLIPEVILEMYKLGLNLDPIFSKLISRDIPISQPKAIIPFMNVSDAMPQIIGERESIALGQMSFGAKDVSVVKFGIGLEMDSEIINAVSINLLSEFMKDAGTKFNTALDALAILTLMNGEQLDGSTSSAKIGVRDLTKGFTYRDYLHIVKRMERMGRKNMLMLCGEDVSIDVAMLPEFLGFAGETRIVNVGEQQKSQEMLVHGIIPDNQIMFVDAAAALLKLTYQGMSIETERYARTDINAAYIRTSTGFATKFRDARLIIDRSLDYAANQFPVWLDPTPIEKSLFRKRGTV